MEKRIENGTVYITLCEKMDYESAMAADEEIFSFLDENKDLGEPSAVVLDAANLSYTSSAGIRLLLKIKKRISDMRITHVSDSVYETISITGMEDIFGLEPVNEQLSDQSFDPVFTEPAASDAGKSAQDTSDIPDDFVPVTAQFEEQVKKHPDQIAVTSSRGSYTYEELNRAANRIANTLLYQGVQPDDVVCIILERGIEIYAATLGVLKSGAAYTIVNSKYPDERIEYIYKDADCKFIISSKKMVYDRLELFVDQLQKRPLFFEHLLSWRETENPNVVIRPEHLCYLIYTSGSTGKPKGVMIEHGNLSNFLLDVPENHEFIGYAKKSTCCLAMAQMTFDFSIMEQYIPLVSGSKVAFALYEEIANPNRMIDFMNDNAVDGACFTPSYLSGLMRLPKAKSAIERLKVIDFGAEAFPGTLYTRIREWNADVHIMNGYGPTETTISCTMKVVNSPDNITIGIPNANVDVYVIDEANKEVPQGETGELLIGGKGVGRGYVNLPEKTKEVFIDFNGKRCYKSGDLVRINPDGEIEYLGRKDFQVKIRGLRIELGEVETVIARMPGINLCVASAYKGQYLCLYYTSSSFVKEEEVRAYAKEHLAHYMVPDLYMLLTRMPMTPNQKIDRKALPEPVIAEENVEVVPPETEDQKTLMELLGTIMTEARFGIDTNLMEIGMSSLDIMLYISLIGEHYEIGIAISDLNDHPTIRELEQYVLSAPKLKKHVKKERYAATMLQATDYFATIGGEGNLNIPTLYELHPSIDNDRLIEAIYQTMEAHPGLTMRLETDENGALWQVRQDDFRDYEVRIVRMEDAELDAGKGSLSRRIASDAKWLFDFRIIETDTRKFLFTDYSHLNSDGISVEIVIEDILAAYNGEQLAGETLTMFDLGDDVADFWETKAGKRCVELYMMMLKDANGCVTLPCDKNETTWQPARFTMPLGIRPDQLQDYCKRHHLSDTVVLAGALGLALAKASGKKDTAFAYGYSGRNDSRLQNTVGYIATLMEACCHTEGQSSHLAYLQRFQKDLINLMMFPIMPIAEIVSEYPNALDIVYVYQPYSSDTYEAGGHEVKGEFLQDVMPNETVKTVFQPTQEADGSITWIVDYHGNLYTEETIRKTVEYINSMVSAFLAED